MSELEFAKYHGLGNDFLIVDLRAGDPSPSPQDPAVVRALCDRRFGVGGDGVLAILPSPQGGDARMRVLNADGSEAEMCGNGIRCVAKFLYDRDPSLRKPTLMIETLAGVLRCGVTRGADGAVDTVSVEMGMPRLTRGEIPMIGAPGERCLDQPLSAAGQELKITAVSMGNPHAVTFVSESGAALRALAERIGPSVETHASFPQKTNAEFARVVSDTEIELVVWERGCGITLACGTGACATAVAACLTGRAKPTTELTLRLLGGPLAITVAHDYSGVTMRGPARLVYDAVVDVAALVR
jgi:diaminopimelate epimerase